MSSSSGAKYLTKHSVDLTSLCLHSRHNHRDPRSGLIDQKIPHPFGRDAQFCDLIGRFYEHPSRGVYRRSQLLYIHSSRTQRLHQTFLRGRHPIEPHQYQSIRWQLHQALFYGPAQHLLQLRLGKKSLCMAPSFKRSRPPLKSARICIPVRAPQSSLPLVSADQTPCLGCHLCQ